MENTIAEMINYYPLIVEAVIEYKIQSRILLAKKNSIIKTLNILDTEYVIQPEHERAEVAKDYRIIKHNGDYLCLFRDQTGKFNISRWQFTHKQLNRG